MHEKINRIEWIDTAKGIGILLVVIGHIQLIPFFHDCIFLFHMPLFFFISGTLFKKNESWKNCFTKKIIHLLLPYPFFMFLFVPLRYITNYFCTGEWESFKLSMLGLSYFDKPLWFLFALFITTLIMRSLYSFTKKINIIVTVIILGFIGYLLLIYKIELPVHISRSLFLLPFFGLGIIFKTKQYQTKYHILFCCLCFITGIIGLKNGHIYLNTLLMQVDKNPLYVYIPAYGGIMLTCYLSIYICQKFSSNSIGYSIKNYFNYLGKNSLYIFAIHYPIIIFINSIIYGSLAEPTFSFVYAVFLIIISIIFSILISFILKKIAPIIFH